MSKALELARKLDRMPPADWPTHSDAAAELRRLHEVNAELLEALRQVRDKNHTPDLWKMVNEAIAKAEQK